MIFALARVAAFAAMAALCGPLDGASAADDVDTTEIEFPVALAKQELKASRLNEVRSLPRPDDIPDLLVVLTSTKWKPGKTLTVAFLGGDRRAHERIERVASEWTKFANIKFDFGRDSNGDYRRWTADDTDYAADIRIAFNAENLAPGWWRGWWSASGTESRNPDDVPPNAPSMNFEGYDRPTPPGGWQITVLHEFGHALGLAHEHQHPATECDWRWNDDGGYELTRAADGSAIRDKNGRYPGIYTVLGGPPRPWSRQLIDNNYRRLENQSAYGFGAFDKFSIMKYFQADWMYVSGKDSPCYSPRVNAGLSQEDKTRIAEFYPGDPVVAAADVEKRKTAIMRALSQLSPSSELAKELRFKLQLLQ